MRSKLGIMTDPNPYDPPAESARANEGRPMRGKSLVVAVVLIVIGFILSVTLGGDGSSFYLLCYLAGTICMIWFFITFNEDDRYG